jgi:hypothetical protein
MTSMLLARSSFVKPLIPLVRRESDIPPEPTCLRYSNAASALKGGEAVPAGDWSEAETLERITSEVAMLFHGSGDDFFFFHIPFLFFVVAGAGGVGGQREALSTIRPAQTTGKKL